MGKQENSKKKRGEGESFAKQWGGKARNPKRWAPQGKGGGEIVSKVKREAGPFGQNLDLLKDVRSAGWKARGLRVGRQQHVDHREHV